MIILETIKQFVRVMKKDDFDRPEVLNDIVCASKFDGVVLSIKEDFDDETTIKTAD